MPYITNADILSQLGSAAYVELTDDAGTGSADESKVDAARLGAEGEADSYFAVRYAVPIDLSNESAMAEVIKTFVLDLAVYRLQCRRMPVPADTVRRRNDAVNWLTQVAAGTVRLPSVTTIAEATSARFIGEAIGPPRMMTRETLDDV